MLPLAAAACDPIITKFTEWTQQALCQLGATGLSLGIHSLVWFVAIDLRERHTETFLQKTLKGVDTIKRDGKLSA
jgi:hypothetical protein